MTELEFKMRFSDLKSAALSQSHENKGGEKKRKKNRASKRTNRRLRGGRAVNTV